MAKGFLACIVCLFHYIAGAQVSPTLSSQSSSSTSLTHSTTSIAVPFAPTSMLEHENRINFIQNFSYPIQLRNWEIEDDTLDVWKRWTLIENFAYGKDRGSIPMIVDLNSLHPYFRDKIVELIRVFKSKGIELVVLEAYRTRTKQNEYKSMGRKYTRASAGSSKHQYGLAVDLVPVVDSVIQWNNIALWRKIGAAGERLGLRWGGRWRRPFDPAHFEWTGGAATYSLAQGAFPIVPKPAQYPCIEEDLKELQRHWKSWEIEQESLSTARKEVPSRESAPNRSSKQMNSGGGGK